MLYSLDYLSVLKLNNNKLTNFVFDFDQGKVQNILLDNNNLTFSNQSECPIKSSRQGYRLSVGLSNNYINDLNSIKCLINNSNIINLDVSSNDIDSIDKSHFKFEGAERRSVALTLNLTRNLIDSIEYFENEEELEIDALSHDYSIPAIKIDVSDNVLICEDCNMLEIIKNNTKFDTSYFEGEQKIKFTLSNSECLDTLFCESRYTLGKDLPCPEKCLCTLRRIDRRAFVDCFDSNINEFPKLPDYTDYNVDGIDIDVSNNSLKNLTILQYDASKIKSINAANNEIADIRFNNYPTNIETLSLANNKLEQLDSAFTAFLYARGETVGLKMGHNPWVCENDEFDYNYFQKQMKSSIQDYEQMKCTIVEFKKASMPLAITLLIWLIAICLMGGGGFVVYKRIILPRKYDINFRRRHIRDPELNDNLISDDV